MQSQISKTSDRLASLDILRGFDLFLLVFFQPVFVQLIRPHQGNKVVDFFLYQFDHVAWQGFSCWDLVMPLFLFMVGAAMPFSFEKFKNTPNKFPIYKKIIRRFVILFILGMIVQGNLLSLNLSRIYLYTNTLQAIAVGYLIAAVVQLHFSNRNQYMLTFTLLIGYWALLHFLGDYTPTGNFAEKVDRTVLGRFRDGVSFNEDGNWTFSPYYDYTWILSSMTFGVTVMLGVFAGKIMKNGKDKLKNSKTLFLAGTIMLVVGWIWGFQTPIIKRIWTSSMTLFSGGICFILMAAFYYQIDVRGKSKGLNWLKIYGMNSIVAYTLGEVVNFRSIASSLLWGTEKYIGEYYPTLLTFANFLILFFILQMMYKMKIFVKI